MSTWSEDSSVPQLPGESAGSSVSTSLQKEYEELLRYAVVTPKVVVPQLKTTNKLPESTTSTETSNETYEQGTDDVQREVTGLPSTPLMVNKAYENHGVTYMQDGEDKGLAAKTDENSPEATDDSLTSSQSMTPDHTLDSPRYISPSVDADLVRMESQLDSWCLDMKRNVLAEFAQSKMALLERHKQALKAEKQRHAAEMNKQQNDIEGLKELLYTYEKTMEHKDNIISNMTKAIQKQKERYALLRRFNTWRIKHVDEKKEGFGSNLAKKHRNHVLKCKIWSAWRALVETRWKQKVEKACQAKAQDVCVKLTDEYEGKLQEANKALDEARLEVSKLHAEREIYEETMKKAFMRGVCALNLEAMHMFREPGDEDESHDVGSSDSANEMNPRSQAPRPTTSTAGVSTRVPQTSLITSSASAAGQPARTIHVKAVGRADFRNAGKIALSAGSGPPGASAVSSVLVQRHSGTDAQQAKPTLRHNSDGRTGSGVSARSKQATVRFNNAPPVKVVH